MSHAFQFPDDLFRAIEAYAIRQGTTPDDVILAWARSIQRHVSQIGGDSERGTPDLIPAEDPLIAVMRDRGHLVAPSVHTGEPETPDMPPYGSEERARLLDEIGAEASDALTRMGKSVVDLVER